MSKFRMQPRPTCFAGSWTSSHMNEVSLKGELSSVDSVSHSCCSSGDMPDTDLNSSDLQLCRDSASSRSRQSTSFDRSGRFSAGTGTMGAAFLLTSSSSEYSPSSRSKNRSDSSFSLESDEMTFPKRAPRWWTLCSRSFVLSAREALERWLFIVDAVLRLHTDLMSVSAGACLSDFLKTLASSSFHICSAIECKSSVDEPSFSERDISLFKATVPALH
mmetsp:Transcript_26911/g.62512  ORF Transcript_26911/g.62512 Transcript_26911/m.62512 type:complete len:218 (+) Transcript_26911:662-1315(+)